jgi:hypothetical protein
MLEELIKQLDNRGLLILQVLLGKRAMEILESENTSPQIKKTLLHV